jgi:hypothetical protein
MMCELCSEDKFHYREYNGMKMCYDCFELERTKDLYEVC